MIVVALAVVATGCGRSRDGERAATPASSSAAPTRAGDLDGAGAAPAAADDGARRYTLYWTTRKEPTGGVKVALKVPAAWRDNLDKLGGPSFAETGLGHGPDVVLLPSSGVGPARIDALVRRQFDEAALAIAERAQAEDGSAWISSTRPDGYVDARRYVLAPADRGVVVCVITLTPDEASRLSELQQICSTLRVEG